MQKRPNILHIFTDQQRFDSISALGNPFVRTPNLDRLAREGTVFGRAYSPSPECVPARASMITGWYPGRTGCFSNGQPMPPQDTPTLMSLLRDAGYRTHGVGKCHFEPDRYALRGFQSRQSQEELCADRTKDDYESWIVSSGMGWVIEPHGVRGEMYYVPQPSVLPQEAHPSHWVADRAIDFLSGEETEPWYLFASFIHPHPPFAPPIPWHKLYRAADMPLPFLPDNREDLLSFVNHFQNRYKFRDRGGLDLNLIRCIRAYYHACVSFVDEQIGRILRALEETGSLDNTLILFSSDHGEYLGDYGCFGKRGMHDVSSRVPLIVRWPGGELGGERCDCPASLVDFAPTFLSAAGIGYSPASFDGVDLRAVATGDCGRRHVFSQYNCREDGLYMVVGENGKYIFSAPDNKEYFYDLAGDPSESINAARLPEPHPEFLAMRDKCLAWAAEQCGDDAVVGGTWKVYPSKTMPSDPDAFLLHQDPLWWDGVITG